MVDPERIENICRTSVEHSTSVSFAIHKDDPRTTHIWHGADTACRMIIGGCEFDDFNVEFFQNGDELCSNCLAADPYKERIARNLRKEDRRKKTALALSLVAYALFFFLAANVWSFLVDELQFDRYAYVDVPPEFRDDGLFPGFYYLCILGIFISRLVYEYAATGKMYGYLEKITVFQIRYWIVALTALAFFDVILLSSSLSSTVLGAIKIGGLVGAFVVFSKMLARFQEESVDSDT